MFLYFAPGSYFGLKKSFEIWNKHYRNPCSFFHSPQVQKNDTNIAVKTCWNCAWWSRLIIPATQEIKAGGSHVQVQTEQINETLPSF